MEDDPFKKIYKDSSSLKHNSKYLLSNNNNKFIKNVDISNLEFLNSKYFQNEMSRVILSHISNAFEILVPKIQAKKKLLILNQVSMQVYGPVHWVLLKFQKMLNATLL